MASISSDWSKPSPRSIRGPSSSSIRPVPVPRSSTERYGWPDERLHDRLLDPLVGDVQAADPVPVGGVPGEVLPCRLRPIGPHGAQPLPVVGDRRIGGVEVGERPADDAGAGPDVGEAEERPRPLRRTGDEAGLGEQLEVARHPWLRLAQDLGEVRHGELGLGQQRQDPQPGRLPGRLEGVVEGVEREPRGRRGGWRIMTLPYGHKDMFISKSTLSQPQTRRTVCVRSAPRAI